MPAKSPIKRACLCPVLFPGPTAGCSAFEAARSCALSRCSLHRHLHQRDQGCSRVLIRWYAFLDLLLLWLRLRLRNLQVVKASRLRLIRLMSRQHSTDGRRRRSNRRNLRLVALVLDGTREGAPQTV